MREFYRITACVTETRDDRERPYTATYQVPTFVLDADIQGITNERHAEQIAVQVVNPCNSPNVSVSVAALRIEM